MNFGYRKITEAIDKTQEILSEELPNNAPKIKITEKFHK